MAVQFAGSGATGNRRRRRIVVNGDGSGVDASLPDGEGGEIESQLVASAAAAPWVPASEARIWIYSAVIAVVLGVLVFVLVCPTVFHADLLPLTDHLFTGPRPTAVVCAEAIFLALATQLGLLIGWYRARCKLDFSGRYRVWPWVVGLSAMGAFCLATNTHRVVGEVIDRVSWLSWRGHVVAWLLPFCVAALPISLLLDRDVRNSRSSLYTLRLSGLLWLTEACLELFQPELRAEPWFELTYLLVPLFASATLFIGLWHHARIVAYVCPDPPQLEERSAWSVLSAAACWMAGCLVFWRKSSAGTEEEDEDAKPKRRRKKVEGEETATKRKRKAPAKRAAPRTRTRVKAVEEEEESEESAEETTQDPTDEELEALTAPTGARVPAAKATWNKIPEPEPEPEEEEEEEEPEALTPPKQSHRADGRFTQVHKSHGGSVPQPHSRKQSQTWAEEEEENEEQSASPSSNESYDDGDDDDQFQRNSGLSADQMKGLSKRQKRDLKKQMRDQERARGR